MLGIAVVIGDDEASLSFARDRPVAFALEDARWTIAVPVCEFF
jgi:hypothetical protein